VGRSDEQDTGRHRAPGPADAHLADAAPAGPRPAAGRHAADPTATQESGSDPHAPFGHNTDVVPERRRSERRRAPVASRSADEERRSQHDRRGAEPEPAGDAATDDDSETQPV
jgi:hypothetical protein